MSDALKHFSGLKLPKLMGILNLTPDSFSDAADFYEPEAAVSHAERMIQAGADIIDLGAESTRPGSGGITIEEETRRLKPVLNKLMQIHPDAYFSVDTRNAETARLAIGLGVQMINDVSALRHDAQMAELLAGHPHVKVVLMHMQGNPQTMQDAPYYEDLFGEIAEFFDSRIAFATAAGIERDRLLLDPGIGFGKNLEHNLALIAGLQRFQSFGLPLVLGASRKRFIGELFPSEPKERIPGSLAAALIGALQGVAMLRIHDLGAHIQFFRLLKAITGAKI